MGTVKGKRRDFEAASPVKNITHFWLAQSYPLVHLLVGFVPFPCLGIRHRKVFAQIEPSDARILLDDWVDDD